MLAYVCLICYYLYIFSNCKSLSVNILLRRWTAMELLKDRNKPAFEDFYKEYYDKVVWYIQKKLDNYQDAQDIASDVFVYCYSHYQDYDPMKSALSTWLYLIVNSRIKNHYRDSRVCEDLETVIGTIADDSIDLNAGIYLEQLRQRLEAALRQLPQRQRMIVKMAYFEGKSGEEIASILDMPPGNVRVTLSRALNTLRKHCSDLMEGD